MGITGKSTFREFLAKMYLVAENYDCDYDRDKLPHEFLDDIIYIIEDVHGPTKNAVYPLKFFDEIYYLLPSRWTHFNFWLSRMAIWFKTGKFSWNPDLGESGEWQGTDKPFDLRNIIPIFKTFWNDFSNKKQWIKDDLRIIRKSKIPFTTVIPLKIKGRIYFSI